MKLFDKFEIFILLRKARFHKVGRYDQLCRNVTTNLAVTMLQLTWL